MVAKIVMAPDANKTMAAILIDFWPYPRFGTNLQNNKQLLNVGIKTNLNEKS
jgi:hypothetical protein